MATSRCNYRGEEKISRGICPRLLTFQAHVESIRPSVQTKLSMNGSKASAPPKKNLPPTAITFFRSKCLLAQERAESGEPERAAQCLMAHGVTKRAGKDISRRRTVCDGPTMSRGRTKATWSLMGKSIPPQIRDSAMNLIRSITLGSRHCRF